MVLRVVKRHPADGEFLGALIDGRERVPAQLSGGPISGVACREFPADLVLAKADGVGKKTHS